MPRAQPGLNGDSVPRTSAVFPGDLVQTKADAVVHINATGSSVTILSDSLVKYEGNTVSLEHGAVKVATVQGMSIRAGEVAVQPANANGATDFDVSDVDGTVHIAARKGDVSVSNGTETTTLAQGEQTTRDDRNDSQKQKKTRRAGGQFPPPAVLCSILLTLLDLPLGQPEYLCTGHSHREMIQPVRLIRRLERPPVHLSLSRRCCLGSCSRVAIHPVT